MDEALRMSGIEQRAEGASDASLYTRYSELKKDLSDAMDVWTERTMELEAMS